MWIQIILIAFMVFAVSRVIIRMKNGDMAPWAAVLWVVLWCGAAVAVLKPSFTTDIALALGVGRGVDLVFYVSITLLFYFVFKVFIRLEKMERMITRVVQDRALKESESGRVAHDAVKK